MKDSTIPNKFYYYWNDAVNSTGYSSKLVLMFSAIEALAKQRNRKKDFQLIKLILGEDLKNELFGIKGLRHRLIHGEYFANEDNQKDYLSEIHKKFITFFNINIFNEKLLSENVIHPQRHPFGNKEIMKGFFRAKDKSNTFNLKQMVEDFDKDKFSAYGLYQIILEDDLYETY